MNRKMIIIASVVAGLVVNCTAIPEDLKPVSGFEIERYLGKWYEIARLDHSFERHLKSVSATYTRWEDGEIRVVNEGFDLKTDQWKQIEGRARFLGNETVGSLKVSFFGPFYGGYHIIELDKHDYSYAMVTGPSRSYLWILSRTTTLDGAIYSDLVTKARRWGFDTDKLIIVEHNRQDN